jgi:exonuclease VII small subunit
MEEKKVLGIFEQMQDDIRILQEKVKLLENKHQKDDFTVKHYKDAVRIVGCCRQTLKKAIDEEKLINGKDYRYNGKRYLFSSSSLKNLKGTI